jgi:hypothetical protein
MSIAGRAVERVKNHQHNRCDQVASGGAQTQTGIENFQGTSVNNSFPFAVIPFRRRSLR